MRTRTLAFAGLAGGGGAAAVLLRRMLAGDGNGHAASTMTDDRWHFVTINRPQQDVVPQGRLPDPLARLGDRIDVQVRPAPAGRGTEVGGRVRGPVPAGPAAAGARLAGTDPRQELRTALRHTQMLLETGEILSPDKPPSTRRTIRSLPLELATRRARGEGRL